MTFEWHKVGKRTFNDEQGLHCQVFEWFADPRLRKVVRQDLKESEVAAYFLAGGATFEDLEAAIAAIGANL